MRVLPGCVNSSVSLAGFDLARRAPFWHTPGNVLRVCAMPATRPLLESEGDFPPRCVLPPEYAG